MPGTNFPAGWLMLLVMERESDDKTLMVRYRHGDVASFEVLYMRHKGPLYRFFLRHGFSCEPAAEMMQEVWMKIIRARESYEPDAKFTTYLYRVAHNCLVDHSRRSAHKIARQTVADDVDMSELPTLAASPETLVARDEKVVHLRVAVGNLPLEQREAFILKHEAELSLADIAAVTGVSMETAKSRLRYAFNKLRHQLAEDGEET